MPDLEVRGANEDDVPLILSLIKELASLFVIVWVAIFGGLGALLARARGGSAVSGLTLGATLGPLGWVIVLWRTRGTHREIASEPWTEDSADLDDWTAQLFATDRS